MNVNFFELKKLTRLILLRLNFAGVAGLNFFNLFRDVIKFFKLKVTGEGGFNFFNLFGDVEMSTIF